MSAGNSNQLALYKKSSPTSIIYLDDLKIAAPELGTIRVRIIRKWQEYYLKTGKKWGFGFIVADEKGSFAYAKLNPPHEPRLKHKLTEQGVYEMNCLNVHERPKRYNTVRRDYIITFEGNTQVRPIETGVFTITTEMPFQFVRFEDVHAMLSNDFLIDVLGFIASCTPVDASGDKKEKYIVLQDDKGATLKLTIWEDQFKFFDESKVQENCVLVLTSVSVSAYQGVVSLSTKPSTLFFYDLNIPEVQSLKDTDTHINMKRVETTDIQNVNWQDCQRVTLDEMVQQYHDKMEKASFCCECKITTFWKAWAYFACEKCFRGVEENDNGKSYCNHCSAMTNSFQAYNAVVDITDGSRTCEATIWASTLEKFFKMDVRDLAHLGSMGLDLGPQFRPKLNQPGIFQISMDTYKSRMSLSVSKYAPSTKIVPHGDTSRILEDGEPKLIEESTLEEVCTPAKKEIAVSKKRKAYGDGYELSADADDEDGAAHEDEDESLDDADDEGENQNVGNNLGDTNKA